MANNFLTLMLVRGDEGAELAYRPRGIDGSGRHALGGQEALVSQSCACLCGTVISGTHTVEDVDESCNMSVLPVDVVQLEVGQLPVGQRAGF